ncbi:MAG: aspartate aminotransferase family protein [Flavobacteriales bacterium]|nr:aspartate aminotransferase family protein [Flavobacteriales bacterium]
MATSPLAPTSPKPIGLDILDAEGIYLRDRNNKQYIDLISGIAVNNLGHRHPSIIQALKDHLDHYLHAMVYGEFVQEKQLAFAKLLTEHLASSLNNVYFTNSGSEAVEGALKLAKKYTRRTEILAFEKAYHGSTHGALSVTGNDALKSGFGPLLPGVFHGVFNEEVSAELINHNTAAVIVEVIQGEAGVRNATPSFLKRLRERCTAFGALLIIDESQTAFGRTGHLYAHQSYDVIPDILVLAKALGGGMPLGAFIASGQVMNVLSHDPALGHITTFGGHPLSCAAGLAHMQALISEGWMDTVAEKEKRFRENLSHPLIKEIRGSGLMLAVELGNTALREKACDQALKNGLLTDWFLFCDTALRIAPPLTITLEQIDQACAIIDKSLNEAE